MIFVAEDVVLGFVVGVPDGDARVIPVVAHPVLVLADHLVGVVRARVALVPARAAGPDEELVLDQQAHLVADVQPAVRHRPDAEPEIVPVHFLRQIAQQLAHPGFVPGQVLAERVLEEPVQRDVRAAQVIDLAVQVGPLRGGVEPKLAHAETRVVTESPPGAATRPRRGTDPPATTRWAFGNRDRLRDDALFPRLQAKSVCGVGTGRLFFRPSRS